MTGGCQVNDPVDVSGNTDENWLLHGADQPAEILLDTPNSAVTVVQIKGDYLRVPADIRRTAKKLAWGLMIVIPRQFEEDQPIPKRVDAQLLLDNERTAVVKVTRASEDVVRVAVRVGIDGDPRAQKQFIKTLRTVLALKPMPRRGGQFRLPDP
jgi:hypothetical protein